MNIYVASSWRNLKQPEVVETLRAAGHEVYDFRHPIPGDQGFSWGDIAAEWEKWSAREYIQALEHPRAQEGFNFDMSALEACDVCVLVLPSGRSAHLEAGFAKGAGKRLVILTQDGEVPELMYKMADLIVTRLAGVVAYLERA